jgi:hypothetical protein
VKARSFKVKSRNESSVDTDGLTPLALRWTVSGGFLFHPSMLRPARRVEITSFIIHQTDTIQ